MFGDGFSYQSFFDTLDRAQMQEMLRQRIPDGSLRRLVGKCLHVGLLEGEQYLSLIHI